MRDDHNEPPVTKAWEALPGPQKQAFESIADIIFYGGAAGGGKTDLIIGVAHLNHRRSIIFRREFSQMRGIIDRASEIFGDLASFNKSTFIWTFKDGRSIELGAVQHPGDEIKYQGRSHDLAAFDELSHFTELQFRTLCGWMRTAEKGQRCRIIATGNPPTSAEGNWIIRYFAPWLDRTYHNPAKPGELRWFSTLEGKEKEFECGGEKKIGKETIIPQSRTFIPARVEDNPYFMATGYKSNLQSLPEPLRSKMLYGDFSAGLSDHPYQLIPTEWIDAAQKRWTEEPPGPMDCIGVDVARGGFDKTILTLRSKHWFAVQQAHDGMHTPNGTLVAQLVVNEWRNNGCNVQIDVIGVGASVFDILRQHLGVQAIALNAAHASTARDKSGQLSFLNRRAEWWWKLRESLDPTTGDNLALPPDQDLLADLVAPHFSLGIHGIQVESKDDIIKRLGRSPDRGDSLVYAHACPHASASGFFDYYKTMAEKNADRRGKQETRSQEPEVKS